MTTQRPLKTSQGGRTARPEPLPDPPPLPDGMQQNKHITRADQTLETWFHGRRQGVLVNGQGYLFLERPVDRTSPRPDCIVAFDVKPERISDEDNGYIISNAGKPPEFVLEVASSSTGEQDYTDKRKSYTALGVGEYWRFDHTGGDYHDAPLAGDRLVDGVYVPIPLSREPEGVIRGHSADLDLDLCWDNGQLRFYDPVARAYLPTQPELKDQRDAAQARAIAAEDQRDAAQTRAITAEDQRDAPKPTPPKPRPNAMPPYWSRAAPRVTAPPPTGKSSGGRTRMIKPISKRRRVELTIARSTEFRS